MKRSKLLMIGMLTAFSLLAYGPAKAGTTTQSSQQDNSLWSGLADWWSNLFGGSGSGTGSSGTNTGTTPTTTSDSGGTSLPVNGNAWLLVITGAAVGCSVIMTKNKIAEAQKI